MSTRSRATVRLFTEMDIREGNTENLGICALPQAAKRDSLWNRMLNAMGGGVMYVRISSSPSAGQKIYQVGLREARQFITANEQALRAIGVLHRQTTFTPEEVVGSIERLYPIYHLEKEKLIYLKWYWKIKTSPELMAYLSALGITLPKSVGEISKFMTLSLLKELSYEKEQFDPKNFAVLQERIEKKFFSEHVVRLSTATKEAVRRLRSGAMPVGEVQTGAVMIHEFLAGLSHAITMHRTRLPSDLQQQFDQSKLLGLDEGELMDFVKVLDYRAQRKKMEEAWKARHSDKPLPKVNERRDIVAFVDELQTVQKSG